MICIIIYYKKKISSIRDKIKDIIYGIKNWKYVEAEEKAKRLNAKKEKNEGTKINNIKNDDIEKKIKINQKYFHRSN